MGPNLSETIYGFRAEWSTVDAISRVKELAEKADASYGELLPVSLDIANAFNSKGRWCVLGKLHGVPAYLQTNISNYLVCREVTCPTPNG